jgi:hypothetical protein
MRISNVVCARIVGSKRSSSKPSPLESYSHDPNAEGARSFRRIRVDFKLLWYSCNWQGTTFWEFFTMAAAAI